MKQILAMVLILMLLSSACAETLAQGSKGDDVAALQQKMIDLGYLHGKADGVYGSNTAGAVRLLQGMHGLEQTGEADGALLALLESGDVTALPAALRERDKGEAVVALQQRLIDLGFLLGAADGIYGAQTAQAVTDFQARLIAQGMPEALLSGLVEGVATGVMQQALLDPAYSSFLVELKPGDEHDEVIRLERELKALGYFDGRPDALYDDYTGETVLAFRAAAGLEPSSSADRALVDALFAADAPAADHYVLHDVRMGEESEEVRRAQQFLLRWGMLAGVADNDYDAEFEEAVVRLYDYLTACESPYAAFFEQRETVSEEALALLEQMDLPMPGGVIDQTSDAEQIARVQRRLHTLCDLRSDQIDGDYGERTQEAVRAFQARSGLEQTGVADEATQQALFSDSAVGNWTPYRLDVSIDEQRVHVYELNDEGAYERIHTFICSTGRAKPTPKGIFLNTGRISYWHHFKDFDCWAQYSFQINGPILFHSILYYDQDVETLRQDSYDALGKPASHGCVRLLPEDAQWIFENCGRNTIVRIY